MQKKLEKKLLHGLTKLVDKPLEVPPQVKTVEFSKEDRDKLDKAIELLSSISVQDRLVQDAMAKSFIKLETDIHNVSTEVVEIKSFLDEELKRKIEEEKNKKEAEPTTNKGKGGLVLMNIVGILIILVGFSLIGYGVYMFSTAWSATICGFIVMVWGSFLIDTNGTKK